jgi:serine/threonine protein kinase/predicted ATPase
LLGVRVEEVAMQPPPGNSEEPHFHSIRERFKILRRIGAGGMGVVYEVYDRERDARVALKTLRQQDPHAIYRFKNEFRSLTELVHPNLVPLYELISDGSEWCFTMEFVEGVDLLTYLRTEPDDRIVRDTPHAPSGPHTSSDRHSRPTIPAPVGFGKPYTDPEPTPSTAHWPGISPEGLGETVDHGHADSTAEPPTVEHILAGASESGLTVTPQHLTTGAIPAGNGTGATSQLQSQPRRKALDFDQVRDVFAQLSEGVSTLHVAGKLHRDLKPGNVLVRKDGRVILLDFGLIADLGTHIGSDADDDESTPRKPKKHDDRVMDYTSSDRHIAGTISYMSPEAAGAQLLSPASDWYSMGVMLYQVLTERLPIRGTADQILLNKQLIVPPEPSALVDGIPADLNALCIELLNRDPARRPRGAEIRARLTRMIAHGQTTEIEETLPFVGREQHLAELTRAFEATQSGQALVYHLHGKSGAGKSALLQRFLEDVVERRGAVILAGRCYEQESVPYKAVDNLVDALTRHLLRMPARERVAFLPGDVSALARIFPVINRVEEVAASATATADMPDLRELRQRAFAALRELLKRLGERSPLILCIDDLQWGDVDSAALLADLVRPPDAPRMLLLIAYRSEYVGTSACLHALTTSWSAPGATPPGGSLAVEALSPEETLTLAQTLLHETGPNAAARADWVVRESGGSAFFIYELVRHLRSGMTQAAVEGVNLDEVLWQRVQRLPEDSRHLVELVAVAGKPLALRRVQQAAGLRSLSPQVILALRAEHLVRTTGPHLDDDIESFHDRVRESVVAHLTPALLRFHHAALAEALEAGGGSDAETLAVHFHEAGQHAKASRYYSAAAEQAVRVLAFERAEDFFRQAATLAPSDLERADVYEEMIHFYTDLARFADAYAVARTAVQMFGVRLPAKFIPPHFALDFIEARIRLRGRKTADLLDLPTIADPRLEAAVRLMNAVAKAAYQVRPELCVAVATRAVNLCLRHGNSRDCAIGYMVFGAIFQGGVLGNHQAGYDFGRLALSLVEKYSNAWQRAEVNFVVGYFGTSWLRPVAEAEALWRITVRAGLETGDWFHTGCACAGIVMSMHMRGAPMNEVWTESERFLEFLRPANLREPIGTITAVRQVIRNLRGQTREPRSWSDADCDETQLLADLPKYGSRHLAHFIHIARMQTLYLRGEYERAHEAALVSRALLKESPGMLHSAEHDFYDALIVCALFPTRSRLRCWVWLRTLRKIQRRLQQWAKQCPDNFLAKERLVSAEINRIRGRFNDAQECYAAAATVAERFGYLQIRALAHQLASQLHRTLGEPERAGELLILAREAYRRWGADAYADELAQSK